MTTQLPVLDISRFHAGPEARAAFVDELRAVLHEHGFFYLKGHDVPEELTARLKSLARSFFALPEAEKLKIEMVRSPHFRGYKDSGIITILLQDEIEGLRVQTLDGDWLNVPPLPGTFVINSGELLELATNGFVRADIHDVVAPPPGVERYSFAFFLGAPYGAVIPVLPLPEDLKSRERGLTVDPLNPLFRNVGLNQLKSRLRSHPDVAQAHHGDLLRAGLAGNV